MVGIVEVAGAINGLKGAMDIAKGLNAVSDAVKLNEAKIALQGAILDAQQALLGAQESHTTDLRRIDHLEQEIVRLKDWAAEKERYELKRYNPGSLAYVLKPSMAGAEPPHRLCANCYQQDKKSILQATHVLRRRYRVHNCPSCKSEFEMGSEFEAEEPTDPSADDPTFA